LLLIFILLVIQEVASINKIALLNTARRINERGIKAYSNPQGEE
jgi:hypothetical protein